MSKPDWAAIEADYLATGLRHEDLAKKWGVPLSTVKKRAMRGKWGDKHRQIARKAEPVELEHAVELSEMERCEEVELKPKSRRKKAEKVEAEQIDPEELALELRRKRSQKMIETTDAMMDRIIDALELIPPDNTYALSTLVKALKDLREMQGLNKSALDIEEQRARIDKLRSETRTAETGGSGGVIILPDVNGELIPPNE